MKIILFLALAMCTYAISFSQATISVDSFKNHMGETVTVCSKVFGIKALEKVILINLGAPYPESPLTVVIFAESTGNFKQSIESLYANNDICVTGMLKITKASLK